MSEKPASESQVPTQETIIEAIPYRDARRLYERNELWKKNIWGLEEWKEYGVDLTDAQIEKAQAFPWSKEILLSPDPFSPKPEQGEAPMVIDTHMALFLPGRIGSLDKNIVKEDMTLVELRKLEPKLFYPRDWYKKESFAAKEHQEGWRLIRKEILPESTDKTFYAQLAMLVNVPAEEIQRRIQRGENEGIDTWRSRQEQELTNLFKDSPLEIPLGRDEAAKEILYYLKNKERLNENYWARCRDLASHGLRVFVGEFVSGGLDVLSAWDDFSYPHIGIASARKFKK